MKIVVGTRNPSKLRAVELAISRLFPEALCSIEGCEVESGVSAQPMSIEETRLGARQRALRALKLAKDATFAVGLEGGLDLVGTDWFECGWIVVVEGKTLKIGEGSSARTSRTQDH